MAARVLLLSVLITEVLKPACAAGIGGNISGRNVSKVDSSDIGLTKGSRLTLEIQPSGHVILGKKGITLSCITGLNENVTWLHNGIPAPPCGLTRCVLLSNGSLHFYKKQNLQMQKFKDKERNNIVNARNHNRDEYRCVARTSLGGLIQSAPTIIQIAELAHVFKETSENITVQEGEVARLSCLIDSVPFPPNITWQHNETLLSYHNESKYSVVPPGVLYISATKLSDAGSYRCIVTNEFLKKTKRSKETKLTVVARAESNKTHTPSSLFPQVSYDHWLLNGSNLNVACAASGYPLPLVTWSFIPRYIDNVTKPRILLNSTTGISLLSLTKVNVSNAGIYLCSSMNPITNDSEVQNITVDVLIPPSFIKTPTNQICPNGRTARFECQAQGLPVPKIYWLKDSLNLTINGRRTTYIKEYNKIELAISATVPSDSGMYQCVAVNAVGEIWAAGRLQVNTSRNSPATPTSLKCHAVSPVKILISWEPPKSVSHTSITAYTVHYSPVEGGKEEVSPPEPGNSTSVEVTKLLEPFTNYSFYIRVWNNYGASDQSATIVCSTAPSVPKSTPKMNVDIISSTKLNVSWEPLSKKESRGVVVEYKLLWKLHQSSSSRWVHYLPATVQYYILSGLEPGARYDLRVLARTKQGEPNISEAQLDWITVTMPTSESNQFTIRNVVDIQVLIVNASIIKMKWKINFKHSDQIESKFDSWQIYCENQNGERLKNIHLPQNITEYLFTDLDANVSYTMRLCMVSSGEATGCLTKHVETIKSNPNAVPMELEAIPISPTSINVSWTLSDVHDVNSFEFCYHAVHVQNSNNSKCSIVNGTKISVDELKPFTLYEFKVKAIRHDTNQTSFFSKSIECYTNEDVPSKVEGLQWFLENNTKVRITWEEPSNINGVIQNYVVAYTVDLTTTWNNVTVPGNKRTTNLPGLAPGKRYFVMVRAATKAGYGKPSNPIIIFTGGITRNSSNGSGNSGGGGGGGGGSSKVPAPSGNEKNSKPDQSLGVILGVNISVGFIMICLCSIYCRKKFENSRLRNDTQPTNGCILSRNGRNGCCAEQSSTSAGQQANATGSPNEIELAVLCPSSPVETNPHSDAKGAQSNGVFEICAKEPLLSPWEVNGGSKDVHIMENPQYKRRSSSASNNQQEEEEEEGEEEEQDLEGTQLTMVNCTLGSSASSLNNNSGCADGETSSLPKTVCASVPALGPNG
ncbi:protogenin isoform X2 [Monomorium pharaonis]|uniref:protogenin isoform X2 n=1 Tax=Monomorium pharaonis TaxID=307658 RepID=UPI0017469A25|nr:protogenin isoform X2 [Monomorium pharaonis]